jgi:hypothetical protein
MLRILVPFCTRKIPHVSNLKRLPKCLNIFYSALCVICVWAPGREKSRHLSWPVSRGRHFKRHSFISMTLGYVFSLTHNALTLLRSILSSIIYHSGHTGAVIAFYSYCFPVIIDLLSTFPFPSILIFFPQKMPVIQVTDTPKKIYYFVSI